MSQAARSESAAQYQLRRSAWTKEVRTSSETCEPASVREDAAGEAVPIAISCVCRLGKEIGFTDDALKSFVRRKEIYTFAPYHECLAEPLRNYQFEVPSMLSSVYEETNSETYQLLSDGHLELILDLCSDYWDGEGLQVMSEAGSHICLRGIMDDPMAPFLMRTSILPRPRQMEKKIYDFYQTAVVNDMQCVAYAYRPINTVNNSRIAFLDHSTNLNDPGFAFHVLPYSPLSVEDEDAAEAEKGEAEVVTVKRRRKRDSNLEPMHDFVFGEDALEEGEGEKDFQMTEKETTEGFYRDVVKGQIFLSMATLCHRPKLNVVDFIEDLGLAGIRFVYFSPTAERESKVVDLDSSHLPRSRPAYAERLGLETDWNCCILLSSADSADCGTGYLQSHDIKARLPRGIDKIRPHLENVDDIPLHVSLFAECTPEATREMIRIFQEYGEVVCCIGNALNAKNTASFALADVSIAMEPMHTKAQSKGRLNLNGVQPPLAIGASLVSLPCGLFMQYETSLYALTQLIGEARRLLSGLRMCQNKRTYKVNAYCSFIPGLRFPCRLFHVHFVDALDLLLHVVTTHSDGIPDPVARVDRLPDFGVVDVVFTAAGEYHVHYA
ncbi:hypothetical protein BC938DRAFT_482020 [Jimgerdemannia flammicorona]|uniref:Uncharacterized protein n=1 Tax=Jimgerdemannia flammicorona TaxID=994334 RepID=A0A433QWQ4_9FUNG|nr:hypothetical protein BC938DRAFT_482020 [Jimgerdemannia flammicorona]